MTVTPITEKKKWVRYVTTIIYVCCELIFHYRKTARERVNGTASAETKPLTLAAPS